MDALTTAFTGDNLLPEVERTIPTVDSPKVSDADGSASDDDPTMVPTRQ